MVPVLYHSKETPAVEKTNKFSVGFHNIHTVRPLLET
jgi:hypothetical protein